MMNSKNIWSLKGLVIILVVLEILFLGFGILVFYIKPGFLDFIKWNLEGSKWVFLLSPILSIIFLWNTKWKSKAILRWHDLKKADYEKENDISFEKINFRNSVTKFLLQKAAILFMILAFIGPKSGGEMQETTSDGVELMIAVDLSTSMLAEDVTPNRLYVAKSAVKNTINQLKGDLVGLVAFAGTAHVQMPMSSDYNAALSYLEHLNTNTVSTQGTSLSSAIERSLENFNMESSSSKIILLITDGEDHEEGLEDVIAQAKEKGVKISCIAMGSEAGAPIPLYNADTKYKKDAQGNTIISKVNTNLLSQIAEQTNGFFTTLTSSSPSEVNSVSDYLSTEQTSETGNFVFVDLTPRFRFPLALSLILLFISGLIKEKHSSWL